MVSHYSTRPLFLIYFYRMSAKFDCFKGQFDMHSQIRRSYWRFLCQIYSLNWSATWSFSCIRCTVLHELGCCTKHFEIVAYIWVKVAWRSKYYSSVYCTLLLGVYFKDRRVTENVRHAKMNAFSLSFWVRCLRTRMNKWEPVMLSGKGRFLMRSDWDVHLDYGLTWVEGRSLYVRNRVKGANIPTNAYCNLPVHIVK